MIACCNLSNEMFVSSQVSNGFFIKRVRRVGGEHDFFAITNYKSRQSHSFMHDLKRNIYVSFALLTAMS